MSDVLYPDIVVKLVGTDGNAFAILGKVRKALQRNKVPQDKVETFTKEAMSGDYDNLLQVCMKWVNVE